MSLLLSHLIALQGASDWQSSAKEARRKATPMCELVAAIAPLLSPTRGISSSEIGLKLDMTRAGVYHVLRELELTGQVYRKGAGRVTKWFLTEKGN